MWFEMEACIDRLTELGMPETGPEVIEAIMRPGPIADEWTYLWRLMQTQKKAALRPVHLAWACGKGISYFDIKIGLYGRGNLSIGANRNRPICKLYASDPLEGIIGNFIAAMYSEETAQVPKRQTGQCRSVHPHICDIMRAGGTEKGTGNYAGEIESAVHKGSLRRWVKEGSGTARMRGFGLACVSKKLILSQYSSSSGH